MQSKDLALKNMVPKIYFVYIMASETCALYIGVTSGLEVRVHQHKQDLIEGFTKKYKCHKLVYFESTTDIQAALAREKQLKGWTRFKKMQLIKKLNSTWKDLSKDFGPDPSTPSDSAQDDRKTE